MAKDERGGKVTVANDNKGLNPVSSGAAMPKVKPVKQPSDTTTNKPTNKK